MRDVQTLLTLGCFTVTSYSLMMTLAAALGCALTVLLAKRKIGLEKALNLAIVCLLGAAAGGHVVYVLCMFDYFEQGLRLLYQPNLGGYTLYGAVLGGLAAVLAYARAGRLPFAVLCDQAAPGAALALAIGRAAEMLTDQGLGEYVDNPAWQRFPFAVKEIYGDYRIPVFAWEALAALVLFAVAFAVLKRASRPGAAAETLLTLLGATQILLEQLRKDDFLRFGFVRFTQLAAITLVVFVMVIRLWPAIRSGKWSLILIVRALMLVFGVLVVIFVEFAFEKPQFLPILRVCIGGLGALCALRAALLPMPKGVRAVLATALVALTAGVLALLHMALDWENLLLTVVMGLSLAGVSVATLEKGGTRAV